MRFPPSDVDITSDSHIRPFPSAAVRRSILPSSPSPAVVARPVPPSSHHPWRAALTPPHPISTASFPPAPKSPPSPPPSPAAPGRNVPPHPLLHLSQQFFPEGLRAKTPAPPYSLVFLIGFPRSPLFQGLLQSSPPAAHHMIDCPGIFHSQLARHETTLTSDPIICQYQEPTPLRPLYVEFIFL